MSEQSIASGQEFGSRDSDPADPAFVANLQQSANLANENCDRAVALAHKLSAQLQEAEDRINQLERERDGFFDQLLAEAKAAIQDVQSNADTRVNRTIREADERIAYGFDLCGFESPPLHSVGESGLTRIRRPLSTEHPSTNPDFVRPNA